MTITDYCYLRSKPWRNAIRTMITRVTFIYVGKTVINHKNVLSDWILGVISEQTLNLGCRRWFRTSCLEFNWTRTCAMKSKLLVEDIKLNMQNLQPEMMCVVHYRQRSSVDNIGLFWAFLKVLFWYFIHLESILYDLSQNLARCNFLAILEVFGKERKTQVRLSTIRFDLPLLIHLAHAHSMCFFFDERILRRSYKKCTFISDKSYNIISSTILQMKKTN